MNAATQPKFGPTLPQIVRPLWGRWGTGQRAALLLVVALLLIGIGVLGGRGKRYSFSSSVAPDFSFSYSGLSRTTRHPGEIVRFEQSANGGLVRSLAVKPVKLPARANPVATTLPFASARFAQEASTGHAGYHQVAEGRTRLNILDGKEAYMLGFTAAGAGPKADGHLWIGKTFLVPAPGKAPDRAVALELLERVSSPGVAAAVRNYPAGFLLSWPTRYWVQQHTSVDVPGTFERVLKSFSIG